MRANRKEDIFMQRRLYIDEAHMVLDIFRERFRDSALPYTAVLVSCGPGKILRCSGVPTEFVRGSDH